MVSPGGLGSNAQGNLGGGNIERVRGKAGQEGQPIGNGDNDGIGAARVEGGRPEILGQGRTMPMWAYNTVMVMEVSGMKG